MQANSSSRQRTHQRPGHRRQRTNASAQLPSSVLVADESQPLLPLLPPASLRRRACSASAAEVRFRLKPLVLRQRHRRRSRAFSDQSADRATAAASPTPNPELDTPPSFERIEQPDANASPPAAIAALAHFPAVGAAATKQLPLPPEEPIVDAEPKQELPVMAAKPRQQGRARRLRRANSCTRTLLFVQLVCSLLLSLWLLFALRPLQRSLSRSIAMLDEALAHTPPLMPLRVWQQQQRNQSLRSVSPLTFPHIGRPRPAQTPVKDSFRLFRLISVAAADVAEDGARFAAPSATEFDAFSAEQLSKQYVVVYRDNIRALGSAGVRNLTRALIRPHRHVLHVVADFDSLPGFAFEVHEEEIEFANRRRVVASLLSALRSHPAVLFVSQDQPLSMSGALEAGAMVPPGIRRVLAATYSSVNGPADVAVAVMDSGIVLDDPRINARHGVNCVSLIERARRRWKTRHAEGEAGDGDDEGEQDGAGPPVTAADDVLSGDASGHTDEASAGDDDDDDPLAIDDNGHGTHVAGIISGLNEPGSIVGVAPGTIVYAVKILNAGGQGSWSHMLCGIEWINENAARLNIKIASMSLAGNGRGDKMCGETNSDALHKAICQSTSQGVLFIAAAGNSASNIARVVPASYPSVLTVTAMADSDGAPGGLGSPLTCRGWEEDDHAASFSNFALVPLEEDAVDNATTYSLPFASPLHAELFQFVPSGDVTEHLVSAPGTCIVSTVRDGRLGVLSGTSQACPHVTGLVALAFGSNGIPGPCATLAPLLCMRYFVSRAHRLQQEAGLGFGFLPWTTERATRAGQRAGTDEVWAVPITTDQKEETAGLREGFELFPEPRDGEPPPPGAIRMRKYFGPIVAGNPP